MFLQVCLFCKESGFSRSENQQNLLLTFRYLSISFVSEETDRILCQKTHCIFFLRREKTNFNTKLNSWLATQA